MHPTDILLGRADKLEIANLQGNDFKRSKRASRLDRGEIHQDEVIAKFLVAPDPFVVVDEIAAAIENKPIAVNLDGLRMMRRMAVDDGNVGAVDERMGKALVLVRNFVTLIRSPMHRNNDQIARPLNARDFIGDPCGAGLGRLGEEINAHWSRPKREGCRSSHRRMKILERDHSWRCPTRRARWLPRDCARRRKP